MEAKRPRGRPRLPIEEKARRALERKEKKKLEHIPKPRGRPRLSDEEKERRALEREATQQKCKVGRKPLDPEIKKQNTIEARRRYYRKIRDLVDIARSQSTDSFGTNSFGTNSFGTNSFGTNRINRSNENDFLRNDFLQNDFLRNDFLRND
jgi:beta-glucosidase-like glycosyl hydrolase